MGAEGAKDELNVPKTRGSVFKEPALEVNRIKGAVSALRANRSS